MLSIDHADLVECKRLLSRAQSTAYTLTDRFKKCLEYGDLKQSEKQVIIKQVQSKDLSGLKSYLDQIFRYIEECDECYEKFKNFEEKVSTKSEENMMKAEAKKRDASGGETWEEAGRMASNLADAVKRGWVTTAIAGAASCVSESLSSGILTAAEACGSTVDSAGRTVSSIGERRKKIEKAFGDISRKFSEIQEKAKTLDSNMFELTEKVKKIKFDTKNVDANVHAHFGSLERTFNILLKEIKNARESISPFMKPAMVWYYILLSPY